MTAPITTPITTVLLGPQRREPNVLAAVESLVPADDDRPVAAITAGWQEREPEDLELQEHLGRRVLNLTTFQRCEDAFRKDPELLELSREHEDRLEELREIYRLRLRHSSPIVRELLARSGDAALLDPEREAAIETVRAIDRHHLGRVNALSAEFADRARPADRESLARHREELRGILRDVSCVCVAGGHVGVLLNRMRLLGLAELCADARLIAWSAGAMVCSERVVLFHDRPPQGPSHAEVYDAGFARVRGILPLPHTRHRLELDDPHRVAAFARRFAPAVCVAFDAGARVDASADGWIAAPGTRVLESNGQCVDAGAA